MTPDDNVIAIPGLLNPAGVTTNASSSAIVYCTKIPISKSDVVQVDCQNRLATQFTAAWLGSLDFMVDGSIQALYWLFLFALSCILRPRRYWLKTPMVLLLLE